jgi:hypothetical protein
VPWYKPCVGVLFAKVDTELIGFAKVVELIKVVDTEIQVLLRDHFLLNSSLATKGIFINLSIWLKTQKYTKSSAKHSSSVSSFGRNSEADEQ